MSSDDELKFKIEQYNRCCEDIRHYDSGVWQIASIDITVAGIMIGIAFQYLSGIDRIFPLLLAFVLSLSLTITCSKYVFFQLGRAQFMRRIELEFGIGSVPTGTAETKDFLDSIKVKTDAPARWFIGRKANRWFTVMLMFTTSLLLVVTIASIVVPSTNPITAHQVPIWAFFNHK